MNIQVNHTITDKKGEAFRIVFINTITSAVYLVSLKENRFPFPILMKELNLAISKKEMSLDEINSTLVHFDENSISRIQKLKRDNAWDIIQFFFSQFKENELSFIPRYRTLGIKSTMDKFSISYSSLKKYLIRFWARGGTKNSLLPHFYNCGAPGLERKGNKQKVGRPRKLDKCAGININDSVKKLLKKGLNKYYYTSRQNSFRTAYELTLKDYFTNQEIDDQGNSYPVLIDSSKLPSYRQFVYWAKKWNNEKKEIITRKGTRVYQQNFRSITGNSLQDAEMGCGAVFQIDSTVFDIYLTSALNRDIVVGRPILFIVIDVYSKAILGINVTYESLNAYTGAMVALYSAMTSKKKYCKKYGIDITDDEFPYCVPRRILTDRGELVGKQIENAIENLGITIQNTPPYHADYKGDVEQAFRQMNLNIKPLADGIVVKGQRERGEIDYRLKSSLTLDEFTNIILNVILFYNKYHVLENYVMDKEMIEELVVKTPIHLWNHGLKHKNGQLRVLPESIIQMALLPTSVASVTPRGVSYQHLLYTSPESLREHWFQKARANGSWKISVSYDPRDLSIIYYQNNNQYYELKLIDSLKTYEGLNVEEIVQIQSTERKKEKMGREVELQQKLKMYQQIESIVNAAREKTNEERDISKSKSKRLSGLSENKRNERELERRKSKETISSSKTESFENNWEKSGEDLTIYRLSPQQDRGDNFE